MTMARSSPEGEAFDALCDLFLWAKNASSKSFASSIATTQTHFELNHRTHRQQLCSFISLHAAATSEGKLSPYARSNFKTQRRHKLRHHIRIMACAHRKETAYGRAVSASLSNLRTPYEGSIRDGGAGQTHAKPCVIPRGACAAVSAQPPHLCRSDVVWPRLQREADDLCDSHLANNPDTLQGNWLRERANIGVVCLCFWREITLFPLIEWKPIGMPHVSAVFNRVLLF